MANFSIDGRVKSAGDIQRNWKWELWIPRPTGVTTWSQEDMTIRSRSTVIPGRGNEPIESNFMGQKQFFPGKPIFPNTFAVMFEEFEDKQVSKSLYSWQQAMHDHSSTGANPGMGIAEGKQAIKSDIVLREYGVSGKLLQSVVIKNAWVQNVDDVSMDYTGAESVKYNVTFQYDSWDIKD